MPYKTGHLLVVIGYNYVTNNVMCMDPAFEKNDDTIVEYTRDDLVQAWQRRKNVAYIFSNTIC